MADVAGLVGQYVAFILSALLTALSFYWSKKKADSNLAFEPIKFIETLITAFILATVAFVLFLTGLLPAPDTTVAETYIATIGLAGPFSLLVQKWAQAIYRSFA